MTDEIALFIGIASGREARWPFPQRLAELARMTGRAGRLSIEACLIFSTDQARCVLVDRARIMGASHLLFLDDDNTFPWDTADRLLAHDKAIIAANYTSRAAPVTPLASRNGERVQSKGRSGIEVVDFAPTGVMLIDMRVFDHLSKPYFKTEHLMPSDQWMSDDVYFCRKAKEAGFETWIDHDLSQQVGHVGWVMFNHTMVPQPEPTNPLVLAKELLACP